MSVRDDEIKRVVAELEIHVAEVEARIAVLKALLADDEVLGRKTAVDSGPALNLQAAQTRGSPPFALLLTYKGRHTPGPWRNCAQMTLPVYAMKLSSHPVASAQKCESAEPRA